MTIGELVAFNSYLVMLAWPMIAFGWVTNLVQRGRASWAPMLAILETVPAIDDRHVTHPDVAPVDLSGAVSFRQLTFRYHVDGPIVLDDISLDVTPGQTIAIVGKTGSGKSTLLSLLARLHDPPPGTVLIDGRDVRELPLATVRGAIGFVPQEPFLFSDTIAENVAFGSVEGPDDQRVRTVAEIARLAHDVAEFPQGYQTRIGERGITLSGGQRQRTAIARALYINPRILVLDDSLSAVDTHTEDEILQRLRDERRTRTTFIVSHRISTVRDADLIVVLDHGRIVEQGTHDQLVAGTRLYATLHRQQLLEAELAAS
jgi:ATP-binding cassette subfamily B protein